MQLTYTCCTVAGLHEPVISVAHATVLRDGRWHDVPSVYLSQGDLVGVVAGDHAPARVRCVEPGMCICLCALTHQLFRG